MPAAPCAARMSPDRPQGLRYYRHQPLKRSICAAAGRHGHLAHTARRSPPPKGPPALPNDVTQDTLALQTGGQLKFHCGASLGGLLLARFSGMAMLNQKRKSGLADPQGQLSATNRDGGSCRRGLKLPAPSVQPGAIR